MKKNVRTIPPGVVAKLKTIKGDLVVAGLAKKFRRDDILAGCLKHLGIKMETSGLVVPGQALPLDSQGKFSDKNRNGEEIIRKDLPKERHYRSIESPNWGDASNGYHTVDLPYEAYPREFNPPRELEIRMQCLNTAPDVSDYLIAFQVDEVLDKNAPDFAKRLLEDLNLLQENIGACNVESSNVSLKDYFKSLHVSWELLPPGTKSNVLQRLFRGKTPSPSHQNVASDRYDFFENLKAKQLIIGSSGFRRYFGALLESDLVVFENIEYGNALYILFNDWQKLSQKSRVELLSGKYGTDFVRVVHADAWKKKVQGVVEQKRKSKKKP